MSNHSEAPLPEGFLGATGRFPQGKLTTKDEGEIQFAIGEKDGKVILDFGKATAWIGFEPEQALQIAKILELRAYNIIAKKGQ